MKKMMIDTEAINSYIEQQLEVWPEAKRNFDTVAQAERKPIRLGDMTVYAQHNPARIRSTAAKTDDKSIAERPCFLCSHNRPEQQSSFEFLPDWELLVNPFPILPVHFTIVDRHHRPQDGIPPEMAEMAEMMPDMVIFYNGAHAGASAPDHRHCQAVLKSELPLLRVAEKYHKSGMPPVVDSSTFDAQLPFRFVSAIVSPDMEGMKTLLLMTRIAGVDAKTGERAAGLVNAFFWMDNERRLRIVVVPRRAHRPACFFKEEPEKMTVSPGALDMAGLLILPIEKDFQRITPEIARTIYSETAFTDSLPDSIWPRPHK